jgi:hypothetical protein
MTGERQAPPVVRASRAVAAEERSVGGMRVRSWQGLIWEDGDRKLPQSAQPEWVNRLRIADCLMGGQAS